MFLFFYWIKLQLMSLAVLPLIIQILFKADTEFLDNLIAIGTPSPPVDCSTAVKTPGNKNSGRALLSACNMEYLESVSESNSRVDLDGEVDDSVISGNSRRMKCKKSRYHE